MSAISQQASRLRRITALEQRTNASLADLFYQMHWEGNLMHREIAQLVGIPRPTVTRWFSELGVPSQPSDRITKTYLKSWLYKTGQLQPKPRYEGPDRRLQEARGGVNVDFFKKWSPEMAYVLGYFAADGCLCVNSRGAHYVKFVSTDLQLLHQVKFALGATQAIQRRNKATARRRTVYQLQIGSRAMCHDVIRLGFRLRKEYRLKLPNVPSRYAGAFVRGYFDGDGCVVFGAYPRKNRPSCTRVLATSFASGSSTYLRHLHAFLEQHAGLAGGFIEFGKKGAHLRYSQRDSIRLFRFMYGNIGRQPFLERKYQKFLKAFRFLRKGP